MKYINKKLISLLVSLGMLAGCASEPVKPEPPGNTAKPGSGELLEPVLPEVLPFPVTEDYKESGNTLEN